MALYYHSFDTTIQGGLLLTKEISIKTVLLEYSHKVNVLLEHDEWCHKQVLLHTHFLCPKNGCSSLMATADKMEVLILSFLMLCVIFNCFIIWESSFLKFFFINLDNDCNISFMGIRIIIGCRCPLESCQ